MTKPNDEPMDKSRFEKEAENVQNKYFERGNGEHYNHIALEEIAEALQRAYQEGIDFGVVQEKATWYKFLSDPKTKNKYSFDEGYRKGLEDAEKMAEEWDIPKLVDKIRGLK